MELLELEKRILSIEERNKRVESDKIWETSFLRRISVAVLTYCVVCVFLYAIGQEHIYLNALIPLLGYWISTVSLGIIRKLIKK